MNGILIQLSVDWNRFKWLSWKYIDSINILIISVRVIHFQLLVSIIDFVEVKLCNLLKTIYLEL